MKGVGVEIKHRPWSRMFKQVERQVYKTSRITFGQQTENHVHVWWTTGSPVWEQVMEDTRFL